MPSHPDTSMHICGLDQVCSSRGQSRHLQWQGPHKALGNPLHPSVDPAGLREELLAWADFGLSLLPWPASAAAAWLVRGGAKGHVGRAPQPPRSIAIIIPDMPRNAAATQSLAQCILWMAEAGLGHISVYDPQGVARGRFADALE